eukprot:gene20254-27008_t
MLDFRPVECNSGNPVRFTPGVVSSKLFSGLPQAGWSWFTYLGKDTDINKKGYGPNGVDATCATLSTDGGMSFQCRDCEAPGYGPNGVDATCATLSTDGGLSFQCRDCEAPGYQPFRGKKALQFWIRPNPESDDEFESSTPLGKGMGAPFSQSQAVHENEPSGTYSGAAPKLDEIETAATQELHCPQTPDPSTLVLAVPGPKLFMKNEPSVPGLKLFMKNEPSGTYCGAEPKLDELEPVDTQGVWFKFYIPLADFK